MTPLQPADVLLLVFAANGGTMEKGDALAEARRVWNLSPAERELWRQRIAPLVRAHAARALADGGE